MLHLQGRTALVTGVGSKGGIGFAIARELCASGAAVFVTSASDRCLERAAELRTDGHLAAAARCDLTDAEDVLAVLRPILGQSPPLPIEEPDGPEPLSEPGGVKAHSRGNGCFPNASLLVCDHQNPQGPMCCLHFGQRAHPLCLGSRSRIMTTCPLGSVRLGFSSNSKRQTRDATESSR